MPENPIVVATTPMINPKSKFLIMLSYSNSPGLGSGCGGSGGRTCGGC